MYINLYDWENIFEYFLRHIYLKYFLLNPNQKIEQFSKYCGSLGLEIQGISKVSWFPFDIMHCIVDRNGIAVDHILWNGVIENHPEIIFVKQINWEKIWLCESNAHGMSLLDSPNFNRNIIALPLIQKLSPRGPKEKHQYSIEYSGGYSGMSDQRI